MTIARIALTLPYTPPLDAGALLDHFANRAVPGIERIDPDGTYVRSLALPHGPAVVTLHLRDGGPPLHGQLALADQRDGAAAQALCRALLDLDHDPEPVRSQLGEDPLLGPLVAA